MLWNVHKVPPYIYSQRNISISLEIVNMYFVLAHMGSTGVRVCVCVSGQSRPRPIMLINASHWCVRGAGRLWLARSKPFIHWQPRHMNGCLLTCSKTIWSCQGSGGQGRKSTVCWCFFGEATGEVLWTQLSRDLLGEDSLSHTLTHTLWHAHREEEREREGECVETRLGACCFCPEKSCREKPTGNF